jgi:serine/threonine protein kinase
MIKQSECPQDAELRRLASGELPKEALETLAAHLETCASCLDKVQTMAPADTLSRALPLARKASAIGDTGEVSGLIGKLKSLSVAPADLLCACGTCGKNLKVKANLAGKKVKCPGCGGIVAVAKSAPAPGPGSSGVEERTLPPDRAIRSEDRTVAPETKGAFTGLHSTPSEHTAGLEKEGDSEAWDFLAPAQEADEIGRLGGYRVLRVLGRGGMGVVFRAEDPNLKRIVALKAMLPSLAASPSSKKRFIREAQTAASIKHDHIVTIHQVGEDRGAPFLAMEFLHGEPLDVRLKRESRLPVSEVLRIGRETAEGLAAAHEAGLIHRDIKPGNVWLESMKRKAQGSQSAGSPRVKILDFGLARATDDTTGLTQSGAIIGTPAYMAPEQANGGAVDHRCDLFSLGCMLYSMTTGQMPFAGKDTMSILMAIAMNDPKPPIELRSDMPIELSDLIVRLLSKKPEDRPADALEVAETLRRIETTARADDATGITTAPVPKKRGAASTRVAPGADVSGSPRRRRGILIGAALALVLAAVVAAGIVLFLPAGNGTIRVEINDPDIEVALTAKGIKIKGADKQGDIVVTPGEHSLKVSRGELFFDTDKIVLKKGDVVTVKVEWLKDKLVAARADTGAPLGAKGTTPVGPPSVPGGNLALQFEGPGRVEIASLKIPTDGPYTLEGYFFPEPAKIGGVDNYAMGVPFQSHLSYTRNGDWRWVASKTAETKSSIAAIPARPQVQHIACVCDGKLRRIYVDGKFVKQAPAAEIYANRPFELGGSFHGTIDEVRVSKVARYRGEFTPQKRFEPDADTLALYHFDEGEGEVLKDSSGNGHHGKITGAKWVKGDAPSPQSSSGVVRHGLQFDGKRSHVIIDRLGRSNHEPRTIEAYLIPATVSIESNKGANVIGYRGPAGMLNIMQMKDSWKGHAVRALKKKSDATFVTGVPGQVRVGVRAHVATIWDGTECRLFVDGKRVLVENEIGIPQFFGTFNATILAASASEPIDRFWAGVMTEVRISKGVRYDKNFSPAERFEPDIDTLALYHFDEGEGDVLKDSSGNGYHGKIVGAKWVKAEEAKIAPVPAVTDADRLAFLDWFYQQQAMNQRIDIEQDGKTFWLKGKRPTGPFLIRRVQLGGGKKSLPDEFAARFAAFPEIQDLHVSIASLEALTHLAPLQDLRRLNLDNSPIPAEGAKIVRGFTKLEHLRVPKPTDEWLKGLAGMPSLRSFFFYRQPVTESELAKLKDFPSLVQVTINDCRLTEAGLLKLKEAKTLRLLVLQKVGIDDPEAFKRLAAALPECEIHHVVFNEPTAIYNKGKAEGLTLAPNASDDDGPP